ncbi:MAG TPA: DUF1844 domain-containing protein [Candidatus Deferrimicrobium sp.]|nr:DUF1844 domain-containing protein [Candidatus Deferrimicrobium sp.]
MPEEKDDKGFKVIDRRGVEPPPPSPPSPPPVETPGSAATEGKPPEDKGASPPKPSHEGIGDATAKEGEGVSSLGVPRFLDLVQSLQMGAMAGLGMLQGPDGKRPPVDLPGAKDAIDLLGILQEKTKGNLTKEEEEVLREGLYHLRMGYMAMINAPLAGRGKGGDPR